MRNRRLFLFAKQSRNRICRLFCGVGSPKNRSGKALASLTSAYTSLPVHTRIPSVSQSRFASSSIKLQRSTFSLLDFTLERVAISSALTGEKRSFKKYKAFSPVKRKGEKRCTGLFCESTFWKSAVFCASESRDKCASSLSFCVLSKRVCDCFLRLLCPSAPIPSTATTPQSKAKRKDKSRDEPKYRNRHKKKMLVTKKVKIKSEIKADFLIPNIFAEFFAL